MTYTEAQRKMMATLGVTEAECQQSGAERRGDEESLRDRVSELETQLEVVRAELAALKREEV